VGSMETIYDWVTMGLFAGLAVLFLQRSMEAELRDSILHYLVAGLGCACANYLGNQGQNLLAILLIVATVGFVVHFLKPFQVGPKV